MVDDLRQIGRQLFRRPGRALLTAVLIGPAIGAAAVGLSLYYTLLIQPLPFPDAEQLVEIWETNTPTPGARDQLPVGTAMFADLRDRTDLFDGVASLLHHNAPFTGTRGSDRFRRAVSVTGNFFDVLGIAPHVGRGIRTGDRDQLAVLSHDFWQEEYGGADDVLGSSLRVNLRQEQEVHEIVGVLPADLWMPPILLRGQDAMARPQVFFHMPSSPHGAVIARMRSDVPIERVRTELDGMAARIRAAAQPGSYFETLYLQLAPLSDLRADVAGGPMRYVASATVFLLAVAGMTVAGLIFVRAPEHQRDLALRAALGAPRRRLVRQVCLQASILAGGGALVGGVLAVWGTGALAALSPPGFPRVADAQVGLTTAGLLAVLWLVSTALLSAVPLRSAWRAGTTPGLGTPRGGSARTSLAGIVIAAELAVCVVLVVGAGLAAWSAARLVKVDTGYDVERVVTMRVTVPQFNYPDAGDRERIWNDLLARLAAIPGVDSVGRGNVLPVNLQPRLFGIVRGDLTRAVVTPDLRIVDSSWFDATGIAFLAGETFRPDEAPVRGSPTPNVRQRVIVNDVLARRLWPNTANVIGETVFNGRAAVVSTIVQPGATLPTTGGPFEVIGVVEAVKNITLDGDDEPQVYQQTGNDFSAYAIAVNTLDPEGFVSRVRPAIAEVDRDFLVESVSTLAARVAEATAPQRFYAGVIAALASVLLVLAALTLYAIVAAAVARRTHEVGVRLALGAGRADVWRWVLAQGRGPVAGGVLLGCLAVWWLQPTWQRIDPMSSAAVVLAGAVALVILAAGLAHALPVRRALSVDPVAVLRSE